MLFWHFRVNFPVKDTIFIIIAERSKRSGSLTSAWIPITHRTGLLKRINTNCPVTAPFVSVYFSGSCMFLFCCCVYSSCRYDQSCYENDSLRGGYMTAWFLIANRLTSHLDGSEHKRRRRWRESLTSSSSSSFFIQVAQLSGLHSAQGLAAQPWLCFTPVNMRRPDFSSSLPW